MVGKKSRFRDPRASRAAGLPALREYIRHRESARWSTGGTESSPERPGVPASAYRLATFAVLTWLVALALAAYDEYWSVPHAAAINAILFLLAVLVIFSLLVTLQRLRTWRRVHAPLAGDLRDGLTGLPNYRYLGIVLEQETSRAERYRRPLTLVIVDVNSLQAVNDQYGRECGDQILRHVADVLKSQRRGSDIVTRLSDDRFALVLPECDSTHGRAFVARLEQYLARTPARVDVGGKALELWVGICAGVATVDGDAATVGDLVGRAEDDLQTAKVERDKRRHLWLSAA